MRINRKRKERAKENSENNDNNNEAFHTYNKGEKNKIIKNKRKTVK